MLVKFLSYMISVFGTKRYKPLLLTCSALIFSFAGISVVTAMSSSSDNNAASSAQQAESDQRQPLETQTPAKRSTRTDETAQTTTPPATAETQSPNAAPTTPPQSTTPELIVNTSTITLAKTSTTPAELTAAISDGSNVQWSITADKPGLVLSPTTATPGSKAVFTVSSDSATTTQVYRLTLQALDNTRNVLLTKTITVTVTD